RRDQRRLESAATEQSTRNESIRGHAEHLCAALAEPVSEIVAHERADHVHIAVREVDQFEYPVNHRVTERNQRVDCAQRDTVDQLLKERTHYGLADLAGAALVEATGGAAAPSTLTRSRTA